MNPTPIRKRWWLWLPLLGLAFWLGVFGDKTPIGTVTPSSKLVARASKATVDAVQTAPAVDAASGVNNPLRTSVELQPLQPPIPRAQLILARKLNATSGTHLFASGSWTPPPPPIKPVPPPPPVAPTAPTLPFTFIGKKLEEGTWEVFLARGEQSFLVREGHVIENTYRIDKISPPNLSLTYLPLGQNQSLSIGASE
jgi:hypothetical protein